MRSILLSFILIIGININLYAETDKEQNLFNYSMNCSALFYIMTSSSIDLSSTKEIREDPEWKDYSLYATRLNDSMMNMANYFLHVLYDLPPKNFYELNIIRAKYADSLVAEYYRDQKSVLQIFNSCFDFIDQFEILNLKMSRVAKKDQNNENLKKLFLELKPNNQASMDKEEAELIKKVLPRSVKGLEFILKQLKVSSVMEYELKIQNMIKEGLQKK
tara:strand:+ start:240 stop:893 length:654 start_codon:yes stop_codon:yes gene_type:complete